MSFASAPYLRPRAISCCCLTVSASGTSRKITTLELSGGHTIRGDQGHLMLGPAAHRITTVPEVIGAIVSGYSLYIVGARTGQRAHPRLAGAALA